MTDTVLVALIAAASGIVVQMIISSTSRKDILHKMEAQSELADQRLDSKLERYQAVTDTKIEELTREVRRHNDFAERIPALEAKVGALSLRN